MQRESCRVFGQSSSFSFLSTALSLFVFDPVSATPGISFLEGGIASMQFQASPCAVPPVPPGLPAPGCFRGTRKPSTTHLLVQLYPTGRISSCPQLVHLYAAHKRHLDLIFVWKKCVFLCTSNNELRMTSLMHSPSKYALILSAHFPPMSLLRSKRNAFPMKQMQMETPSHVSRAACEDSSVKVRAVRIAASSLSFWKQRSRCIQRRVAEVSVMRCAQPGCGLCPAEGWGADLEAVSAR